MALLPIISLFCGQRSSSTTPTTTAAPPPVVVSNIKNIRIVPEDSTSPAYAAFGVLVRTAPDRVTHFFRSGTDHLDGGNIYARHYTISTDTWGNKFPIETDTHDMRDVWGGRMENDEIILFFSTSDNNLHGGTWDTLECFYIRFDLNLNRLSGRVPITGVAGVESLQREWAFGALQKGENPGEYYIGLSQIHVDVVPDRSRMAVLKTTDYFQTFTSHTIYENAGSPAVSENTVVYIGGGKLVAFVRQDQGGNHSLYDSSDYGVTWTPRGGVSAGGTGNIGWYGAQVKVVFAQMRNGKLDFIFQDRDSGWVSISKDNDPALFFGSATLFNAPELYAYNKTSSGSNPSLGYPVAINLSDVTPNLHLVVYSREETGTNADVYYTRDDLYTDPAGVPTAPPAIATSFLTSTSFRLDVTGYNDAQLQNIRYLEIDIATDAGFTTFPVVKWKLPGSNSAVQGVRMPLWISISQGTAATTYHIRIRAANNAGQSAYTQTTVTTLS